jgi:hypothetical protein
MALPSSSHLSFHQGNRVARSPQETGCFRRLAFQKSFNCARQRRIQLHPPRHRRLRPQRSPSR